MVASGCQCKRLRPAPGVVRWGGSGVTLGPCATRRTPLQSWHLGASGDSRLDAMLACAIAVPLEYVRILYTSFHNLVSNFSAALYVDVICCDMM